MFAAVITSFIIPVDREYIGYFDFKTLSCLFSVLAVVCALKNINFFYMLARKVVKRFKTVRWSVIALVYITFIGSMLIANDMALLTFLPLGYFVLSTTGQQKYMAFTFIMQNIAANLGGMLTPFGNPQNLYLYTKYEIPNLEFMQIMAPPFVLSIALLTLCCIVFTRQEALVIADEPMRLNKRRTAIYLVLFALAIIIVFRVIPYWVGLIVIFVSLLILDPKALKMVDYPLLLTFVFFFILRAIWRGSMRYGHFSARFWRKIRWYSACFPARLFPMCRRRSCFRSLPATIPTCWWASISAASAR